MSSSGDREMQPMGSGDRDIQPVSSEMQPIDEPTILTEVKQLTASVHQLIASLERQPEEAALASSTEASILSGVRQLRASIEVLVATLKRPEGSSLSTRVRFQQYQPGRDSPSAIRSVIFFVVSLTATNAFRAARNPPGGLWAKTAGDHIAGTAINAQNNAHYFFLASISFAYLVSIFEILILTWKTPFMVCIWSSALACVGAFFVVMFSVTPVGVGGWAWAYVFVACAVPSSCFFIVIGIIRNESM